MNAIDKTRAGRPRADGYFGLCPACRNHDGYINIGSTHWFVCDEHRTAWSAGANLFSCWREEAAATWAKNREKLRGFVIVEPHREMPEAKRYHHRPDSNIYRAIDFLNQWLIDASTRETEPEELAEVTVFLCDTAAETKRGALAKMKALIDAMNELGIERIEGGPFNQRYATAIRFELDRLTSASSAWPWDGEHERKSHDAEPLPF